jgi:hypothetical protein
MFFKEQIPYFKKDFETISANTIFELRKYRLLKAARRKFQQEASVTYAPLN